MNRLNRPGPTRMDAASLQRYLLASVDRIEADDVTVLWQHQRRLVEIEQDRSAIDRRIIDLPSIPSKGPPAARAAGSGWAAHPVGTRVGKATRMINSPWRGRVIKHGTTTISQCGTVLGWNGFTAVVQRHHFFSSKSLP
jgi:hypothetical protein